MTKFSFDAFKPPRARFAPFIAAQDAVQTFKVRVKMENGDTKTLNVPASSEMEARQNAKRANKGVDEILSVTKGEGGAQDATSFAKGDKVVANSSVQGMTKGQTYTVTGIREQSTFAGNFVTYELDNKLAIGNGHMLLSLATTFKDRG